MQNIFLSKAKKYIKILISNLSNDCTLAERHVSVVNYFYFLLDFYHPDRISKELRDDDGNRKFDDEYIVICEEITKLLNSKYTDMKMAD